LGIVVQKYGGTSVGDVDKIREVAAAIVLRKRAGASLAVVVSAMGQTTDELLALARRVSRAPAQRELDMLVTAGERISMSLLAMAIHDLGEPAVSYTGSQSGILTENTHQGARIVAVRPHRVQDALAQGNIVIVAGYQGVSAAKEVTTLGRGGSDTSAVALAAALGADACEIYSDVDGVFTADPRVCPQAKLLRTLRYQDMREMAAGGAQVLNAEAVAFAERAGIELHARRSGNDWGTVVQAVAPPSISVAAQDGTWRGGGAVLWLADADWVAAGESHDTAVVSVIGARPGPWMQGRRFVGVGARFACAVPLAARDDTVRALHEALV
jgi:aspartate kinase